MRGGLGKNPSKTIIEALLNKKAVIVIRAPHDSFSISSQMFIGQCLIQYFSKELSPVRRRGTILKLI